MLYVVDDMWHAFLYRINLHHCVPFSLQLVCKNLAVTAPLAPMVPLLLQSQPMMWNSRCCNSASVIGYFSDILSWPRIYLGSFFNSSENITRLRNSSFVNVVNHLGFLQPTQLFLHFSSSNSVPISFPEQLLLVNKSRPYTLEVVFPPKEIAILWPFRILQTILGYPQKLTQ